MSDNESAFDPDKYRPKHAKKDGQPGFLSDEVYKVLRFCATIFFPALGTAYFSLAGIWGLPAAEQVVGSIVVIDTLLGVLVRQARVSYEKSDQRFDGQINVIENEDDTDVNIQLDPEAIVGKDEVVVKVNKAKL